MLTEEQKAINRQRYREDSEYRNYWLRKRAEYVARNRDKINAQRRAEYAINPEKHKAEVKADRIRNPEKFRLRRKTHYAKNRDVILLKSKQHYQANRVEIIKKNYKYVVNRCKRDPIFRMGRNIKCRTKAGLRRYVVKGLNTSSAMELVGCDAKTLAAHLESKFQPGMTWQNYGNKGWHIDHVDAIATFDLSDPIQVNKCFCYLNLQPLWWQDNLKKRNNQGGGGF